MPDCYVTGLGMMSYCNQTLFLSGRVGSGDGTRLDHKSHYTHAMTVTWWQFQPTIRLAHWLLYSKEYNRAPKILSLSSDIEINPGPLTTYTWLLLYYGCFYTLAVYTNCGSRPIFICSMNKFARTNTSWRHSLLRNGCGHTRLMQ